MAPTQTLIALLQISLLGCYEYSWILRNLSTEGPQWSHNYEENGQYYHMCWVCCSMIASRYHDNMCQCSFPGGVYKWPSGSGCKHKNPLPCPFRSITSTKGDNLKSERKISLKNYLSQGEGSVISYTISHQQTKIFLKKLNLLWLFLIHLQI